MDTDIRIKSIEAVRACRDLYKEGKIDSATFHKCLVSLAYEFAIGNETGWVVKLLLEVPMSYYKEEQTKHMAEDPVYSELCVELSRLLVLHGMVDVGPIINQPPGIA